MDYSKKKLLALTSQTTYHFNMKYFATKNKNKTNEKHPDFIIYMKDADNQVIQEEYVNSNNETVNGWKKYGAMWFKLENNKITSISIDMKDESVATDPVTSKGYNGEVIDTSTMPF